MPRLRSRSRFFITPNSASSQPGAVREAGSVNGRSVLKMAVFPSSPCHRPDRAFAWARRSLERRSPLLPSRKTGAGLCRAEVRRVRASDAPTSARIPEPLLSQAEYGSGCRVQTFCRRPRRSTRRTWPSSPLQARPDARSGPLWRLPSAEIRPFRSESPRVGGGEVEFARFRQGRVADDQVRPGLIRMILPFHLRPGRLFCIALANAPTVPSTRSWASNASRSLSNTKMNQ